MSYRIFKKTLTQLILFALALAVAQTGLYAQGRGGRGGGRGGPPQAPKAAAPIDLTGYWVSIVTEDWRYRMVTPAQGDYEGVPMTPAAIKVAEEWDPKKEAASPDQCKTYGAPALLRVPERLHITWQDDNTLKMETDAGKQTRIFHFGDWKSPENAPSLQGNSVAEWEMQRAGGKVAGGSLKVDTTNLKAGFLRKNGVPDSDNARLTEYYDMVKERNGDDLMVVTIVVTDPMYLREPFIITSHFKKQTSDAGWNPTACSATW
jgi:hypothetical protein